MVSGPVLSKAILTYYRPQRPAVVVNIEFSILLSVVRHMRFRVTVNYRLGQSQNNA